MVVLNGVGHGLHEKPYENGFIVEFGLAGVPFSVPDLIVFDSIVVDAKVIDRITDHERGQMVNYLRITKYKVGVILNFRRAKLEWERVVLSDHSR